MPAYALKLGTYVSDIDLVKILVDSTLTFSQTFGREKAKSKNPAI
jgi:hypothetical protein